MDIDLIFAINFSPIAGILFLSVFLRLNARLDQKIKQLFFLLLIMEAFELFVYNAELVFAVRPTFSYWRTFFSAVGYAIRPALVFMVLQLALRHPMTRAVRILMALPMLFNTAVAFSAFWTNIAFSYTAANQFVHGPLGYSAHITLLFYLVVFVAGTLIQITRPERLESIILLWIFFLLMGSVVVEAIWSVRSVGRTAMVLSAVFYYMFFQTREYQETLTTEEMIHEQLRAQASTDQVTGLLNKTAFLRHLTQALDNKSEQYLALVFFDLDHFKRLNDTLGHSMGDKALQDVGDALRGTFRSEDFCGRFGGDEFCVLMQMDSMQPLAQKLNELKKALQKTYTRGKYQVSITASIGAAVVPPGVYTDPVQLLETADTAAYAVKRSGRDGYKIVTL